MRIFKPWLYPNFLFNLTKYSKKRNHIKDVTRGFAAKVSMKTIVRNCWKLSKIQDDLTHFKSLYFESSLC